MIYEVQMQFIPGNNQIWVARLNPDDPIYQYDNFAVLGQSAFNKSKPMFCSVHSLFKK